MLAHAFRRSGTSTERKRLRILVCETKGCVGELSRVTLVIEQRRHSGAEVQVRRFGRKPFGFFKGEPEAITKMKLLRDKGLGFDRIAAELNKEGIPTRSRKTWHGVVVNRILSGRRPKQG
jgi:hypothetical protein